MTFSPTLFRSFFTRHRFWTMPVVRNVVGVVYGKTMKGIGTIGWLRGSYRDNSEWVCRRAVHDSAVADADFLVDRIARS